MSINSQIRSKFSFLAQINLETNDNPSNLINLRYNKAVGEMIIVAIPGFKVRLPTVIKMQTYPNTKKIIVQNTQNQLINNKITLTSNFPTIQNNGICSCLIITIRKSSTLKSHMKC